MVQKKQDKYFYQSILTDYMAGGKYKLDEPLNFYEWLKLIENGKATDRQKEEDTLRYLLHFIDKVSLSPRTRFYLVY